MSGSTSASAAAAAPVQVAVITTLGCPYCKKIKAALQDAGIPYVEYELSEQLEVLSQIKAATGQSTVPQVFVGGKLLGGASEVLPLLDSGALQQLLAATVDPPLPANLASAVASAVAAEATAAAAAASGAGGGDAELAAAQRQLAEDLRAAKLGGSAGAAFELQRAVQWLQSSKGLTSEAAAVEALAGLQAAQLLTVVESRAGADGADLPLTPQLAARRPALLLRMVADVLQPSGSKSSNWKEPLNAQFRWFGPARPAAEVAERVRQSILRLYDAHLGAGGKQVDYAALRGDPAWPEFVAATAELQKVELLVGARPGGGGGEPALTRDQRLAFFINVYNALVVHALVAFGPAQGSLSRLSWFDSISYVIGGVRYSSNDVEHGVLRGNAASPASLWALLGRAAWAGKTFKRGDPRALLAPVDPRIHFALNCGAASCPPIRVYTPERLEFGLAAAASAFCASEVVVQPGAGAVEMSMILKWYGPDFGTKQQLLEFVARYLPDGPKAELQRMLQQRSAEGIELRFRPYDWTVNSKD